MRSQNQNIPRIHLILILAALASLGPLSIDMYLPAFPQLKESLGTDSAGLGASLATFFVGLCLGQLIYGPVSDRVGRKKPLLFGLALFIAASLGCALSENIESLVVLRFFQGLGSCSGMVIGRALVRDLFSPTEMARVFSTVMLFMGAAPVFAPSVGQLISNSLGWRAIFYLVALFGALVWLAVMRLIPQMTKEGPASSWSPSVFLEVLLDRTFLGYALAGSFLQAGLFAYITAFPAVVIEHFQLSSQTFSLFFGVNAMGLILASQLNHWLLRRYSYSQIIEAVIGVALLVGTLLAYQSWMGYPKLWSLLFPLFLFVGTLGLMFPNSTAGALAGQERRAGSASAVLGTLQYGLAALASAAMGFLSHHTPFGLGWALMACALLSLLTFRFLLSGKGTKGR